MGVSQKTPGESLNKNVECFCENSFKTWGRLFCLIRCPAMKTMMHLNRIVKCIFCSREGTLFQALPGSLFGPALLKCFLTNPSESNAFYQAPGCCLTSLPFLLFRRRAFFDQPRGCFGAGPRVFLNKPPMFSNRPPGVFEHAPGGVWTGPLEFVVTSPLPFFDQRPGCFRTKPRVFLNTPPGVFEQTPRVCLDMPSSVFQLAPLVLFSQHPGHAMVF